MKTFTFDHPNLGEMTGRIQHENVVQFKAVPYASIPGRFKHSILLSDLPNGQRDFTEPGHACPQTFGQDAVGGGPQPGESAPNPDEFGCLILQLNIPLKLFEKGLPASEKVPVAIYIHGGGFVLGKIDAAHDTSLMVQQSISDGQPLISASFQYRLASLGSLKTPEPGSPNFGLHDQRNALLWIQKFIAGFGGDASRTTVFGESAGSMSICAHLLSASPSSGPLFQRAILMSGVLGPMTTPVPNDEAEKQYEDILCALKIQERGIDGLDKLREIDVQDLVTQTELLSNKGAMWFPIADEEWFGQSTLTWDQISERIGACEWIEEIVLGTTGFEGNTSVNVLAGVTPSNFVKAIVDQIGQENASILFDAYKISPDMDQNLFLTCAMWWMGDIIFDAPTHRLAQYLTTETTKRVYRYVFDVRNPFPGHSLYQQAHHWVDMYSVFKTFQFRYPTQKLRSISTHHARLWNRFVNGVAPWSEYKYNGNQDDIFMIANDRDGWAERTAAEEEQITGISWRRREMLMDSWKDQKGRRFVPLSIDPLQGKKLV